MAERSSPGQRQARLVVLALIALAGVSVLPALASDVPSEGAKVKVAYYTLPG